MKRTYQPNKKKLHRKFGFLIKTKLIKIRKIRKKRWNLK